MTNIRASRHFVWSTTFVLISATTMAQEGPFIRCELYEYLQNQNRYVFGAVNAECSGDPINCAPFAEHSVPWGNWGVDSNLNARRDEDQFAGWKDLDGHQQWNSCTSEFPPPDSTYYNADGATTQRTDMGAAIYAIVLTNNHTEGYKCGDLYDGAVLTMSGNFMDIWELDACDEDEFVATAWYPDTELVMTCDPNGDYCEGLSAWVGPTSVSPNILTAEVRYGAEATTIIEY